MGNFYIDFTQKKNKEDNQTIPNHKIVILHGRFAEFTSVISIIILYYIIQLFTVRGPVEQNHININPYCIYNVIFNTRSKLTHPQIARNILYRKKD